MSGRPRGKNHRTFSLDELVRWYLRNKTRQAGACLLFTGHIGGNGYPKVTWEGKDYSLHRLVCEFKRGPPTGGRSCPATHACGNRTCINPKHLRWGTPSSNFVDTVGHGRAHRCQLSETQVRLARKLHQLGAPTRKLADAAGVHLHVMRSAVTYRSYRWID